MTVRLNVAAFLLLISISLSAQKFDGFVITKEDSLFRGYMRVSLDGEKGRKILITSDKRKTPKSFYVTGLKYYAYKKDTFAILRDFYPFEEDDYQIESIEAKVIISKGAVKLYHATLPEYKSTIVPIIIPTQVGITTVFIRPEYATYIVRDRENNLKAIRKENREFEKSIEFLIGDDADLMAKIRRKELTFRDTRQIIKLYNSRISASR